MPVSQQNGMYSAQVPSAPRSGGQRWKIIHAQEVILVGQLEFTYGLLAGLTCLLLLCLGFSVKSSAAADTRLGFAPSKDQLSSGWR